MTTYGDVSDTQIGQYWQRCPLSYPRCLPKLEGSESMTAINPVKNGLSVTDNEVHASITLSDASGNRSEGLTDLGVQPGNLTHCR
jgi:hypothetical protein